MGRLSHPSDGDALLHTISPASSASPAWPDHLPAIAWDGLLGGFADLFTRPSAALFAILIGAWVLCPGRRTVTRMIGIGDPDGEHAHDAYHRFLRAGAWTMARLWRRLLGLLLAHLELGERLVLDLDDTLFHKCGRKVDGAGSFRDPIRSRGQHTVFAHGLNLVVLTLRVRPPWGGEPLGLPINVRLYRKGGPSLLDLGQAMVEEVAGWLPDHRFLLGCDGAYAPLAGRELPRTHVVSRIKRNAAIFELPPPRRPGQRGRPRKKGDRLPCPERLALQADEGWSDVAVETRGRQLRRWVYARTVLWYAVLQQPVLLVVVADPDARQPDDLFFTTDLDLAPEYVAGIYAGRWSIEDTFRNTKQLLGGENPQSWKGQGPERAAALSLWTYSAIWLWYVACHGAQAPWQPRPWHPAKRTPSFADALATLRRALWGRRIFDGSDSHSLLAKFPDALIEALAEAA